jgi:hypothetical protein
MFIPHFRGQKISFMNKSLLFAVILIAGQTSFAQVPTSGLVSWFPFNNSVNDETGNSTNLELIGTAGYVSDRAGNANSAMFFQEPVEGTAAGWITGQNSSLPMGSATRTIAGWFYADAMPQLSHTAIFSWGSGSTNMSTLGEACSLFAGKDGDQIWFWSAWNDYGQTINFGNGQWYHFAVTFDGTSTLKFYKDGSYLGSQTMTTSINTVANGNVFRIAKSTHQDDFGVYDGHMNGALDDIGVWNRELSAIEIEQLFDAQPTAASIGDLDVNSIGMSPNPAFEELKLSSNETIAVEITDLNGKILYSQEFIGTITVDVNNWMSGVYTVRSNNGQTRKFIKQ